MLKISLAFAVPALVVGLATQNIIFGSIAGLVSILIWIIFDTIRTNDEGLEVTSDWASHDAPEHVEAPVQPPLEVPADPARGIHPASDVGKRVIRDATPPEPGSTGYISDGNDTLPPVPNMGRKGRPYQGPRFFR